MRVIRAAAMGMCFGVRDALEVVERLRTPEEVTIHGELVHNERVNGSLLERGFVMGTECRDGQGMPQTPLVLITAHGVSETERRRLKSAGKELIDTTCPLVRRVHAAAVIHQRQGWFVVVIGRPGHVEVAGVVGDLDPGRYAVVGQLDEVVSWNACDIAIVCQSTTPPFLAQSLRRAIEAANPQAAIKFVDTICRPTRERQRAMLDLLDQVEAVVVVGGAHSNNTAQLAELARRRGVPALRVNNADELDPDWLARFEVVGLTAGTSTLDQTIDEVETAILECARTVARASRNPLERAVESHAGVCAVE